MKANYLLLTFCFCANSLFGELFFNPVIANGGDPTCVFKDGYYYYSQTTGGLLQIRKSTRLAGPSGLGGASVVTVFSPPAPNNYEVWAPELRYINGNWYVYYAADNGYDINHRMYVAKADTQDPMGTWTYLGKIYDPNNDYWAIDGNVIQKADGSLYFVWSGHANSSPGNQYLYIAPMSNPWTISGSRVRIGASAYYSWEYAGSMLVNEAPAIIQHNGVISIVYSANGSWTDNYCMGLLANGDGNLLNPGSWAKNATPVLKNYFGTDGTVYSPGSCTFTKSRDGVEDWIIFHTSQFQGGGSSYREIHAQKFTWTPGYNTPNFGVPFPDGDALSVPSGENVAQETPILRTNGAITSIAVFTDTSVYRRSQTSSNGSWGAWSGLGGVGFKKISTQHYPDDRLAVFGVGYSPVWINVEQAPGGSWGGWSSLGGPSFSSVKSAMYSDERLAVAAVGDGTAVSINAQTSYNGSWGGWGSLGGAGFWDIDLIHRPDDRMVIFGVGASSVWVNSQVQANGSWSGWQTLGGPTFTLVKAILRPDGRFVVFACGNGSDVWINAQNTYEGTWSGWTGLGASGFTKIHPVLMPDGRLEILAVGDNSSVWHNKQLGYESSWNGWVNLGGAGFGSINSVMYPDGKLAAFSHNYNTVEWCNVQAASQGSWGGWTNLAGTLR